MKNEPREVNRETRGGGLGWFLSCIEFDLSSRNYYNTRRVLCVSFFSVLLIFLYLFSLTNREEFFSLPVPLFHTSRFSCIYHFFLFTNVSLSPFSLFFFLLCGHSSPPTHPSSLPPSPYLSHLPLIYPHYMLSPLHYTCTEAIRVTKTALRT